MSMILKNANHYILRYTIKLFSIFVKTIINFNVARVYFFHVNIKDLKNDKTHEK